MIIAGAKFLVIVCWLISYFTRKLWAEAVLFPFLVISMYIWILDKKPEFGFVSAILFVGIVGPVLIVYLPHHEKSIIEENTEGKK